LTYLIEEHHHDIDGWYTDTYAIFDDLDKLLEHIRAEIGNNHMSDWLNYDWFFSVYKINNPFLKNKKKINYLDELCDRYIEVSDILRYRQRKDRESWDNVGMIGAIAIQVMMGDFVLKKINTK